MKSLLQKNIERFLRERKHNRRWLAVFLCLAAAVSVGTAALLHHTGTAMNHTERVLECSYQVHHHTDACYADVDGVRTLVCGYADYVVHVHNDDCYDASGKLVCPLPEIPPHTHTDACYTEERVLVCTIPESDEHQHTDACYETQRVLTCGKQEEHTHTASCYDESGNLICGLLQLEEHVHDDSCFQTVVVANAPEEEQPTDAASSADSSAAEEPNDAASSTDSSAAEEPNDATSSAAGSAAQAPDGAENGDSSTSFGTQSGDGSQGVAVQSGERDLTGHVDSVGFYYQSNGAWQEADANTQWQEGDAVRMNIGFAFADAETLKQYMDADGQCRFVYDLGKGFTLESDKTFSILFGDQEVGTFYVDADNRIHVTLDYNKFVSDTQQGSGEIKGSLTLEGSFARTSSNNGYEYTVPAGSNTTTIHIKPESGKNGINVRKSGSVLNEDATKLHYSVAVTTPYGTKGDLVIQDKLTDNKNIATGYDKASFVVKDSNGKLVPPEDYTLSVNDADKSFELTIHDSDGLDRNETYTVEYDVNITPPTGHNESIKIGNSVHTYDEDNKDNKGDTDSSVDVKSKFVTKKNGTFDKSTNTIKWTITFTGANGKTIQDILPDGVKTDDITNFNVTPALNGLTADSLTKGYKIPDDATGTYTITYNTPGLSEDQLPTDHNGTTISNEVRYDGKDGDKADVSVKPWELPDWNAGKQVSQGASKTEDGGLQMQWQSYFTFPFKNWQSQTFTDTMNGGHYARFGELEQAIRSAMQNYHGVSYTVTYRDANGNEIATPDTTTPVYGWTIQLTNDAYQAGQTGSGLYVGQGVYIQYKTYVPADQVSATDQQTFTNSFGDKYASTDYNPSNPDPTPDPTPTDEKLVKANGNYTSDDVTVDYNKNGTNELSYLLSAVVTQSRSDNGFTITDIIPEGLELDLDSVKLGWYTDLYNFYGTPGNAGWGYEDLNSGKYVHVSYNKQTRELTITFDKGFNCKFGNGKTDFADGVTITPYLTGSNGAKIAVRYTAKIASEAWKDPSTHSQTYTNHFSIDNAPAGSQTTTVNRGEYDSQKSSEVVSNRNGQVRLRYAIAINPNGEDMVQDSDVLTVTDQLTLKDANGNPLDNNTLQAALDLSSVKLYRYIVGEDGKKYDPAYEMDASLVTIKSIDDDTRTVTFTVPDSTPCVLVYEYTLDAQNYSTVSVTNKAELNGRELTDEQNKISVVSGGGQVDYGRIVVTKVDSADASTVLPGAKFRVEYWDADQKNWNVVSADAVTDAQGQVIITLYPQKDSGECQLTRNVIYRLTEVQSPEGYAITNGGVKYLCSLDSKTTADEVWNAAQSSGITDGPKSLSEIRFFNSQGGVLRVENQRTTLSVEKRWEDSLGRPVAPGAGSIDVELVQYKQVAAQTHNVTVTVTTPFEYQTYESVSASVNSGKATITWHGTWSKKFGNPEQFTVTGIDPDAYEFVWDDAAQEYRFTILSLDRDYNIVLNAPEQNSPSTPTIVSDGASTTLEPTGVTSKTTLSAENGWKASWLVSNNPDLTATGYVSRLPEFDESGNAYVYRINEISTTPGYSVSYNNNSGITHGSILVTNRREDERFDKTELTLNKSWLDANGLPLDGSSLTDRTVTFQLYQRTTAEQPESVLEEYSPDKDWQLAGTYQLDAAGGWSTTITNLPRAFTTGGSTTYYVYAVVESGVSQTVGDVTVDATGQYTPSVTVKADDLSVTVTNRPSSGEYVIPSTGGMGTAPFLLTGAGILAAGAMYGFGIRRRRRREGR